MTMWGGLSGGSERGCTLNATWWCTWQHCCHAWISVEVWFNRRWRTLQASASHHDVMVVLSRYMYIAQLSPEPFYARLEAWIHHIWSWDLHDSPSVPSSQLFWAAHQFNRPIYWGLLRHCKQFQSDTVVQLLIMSTSLCLRLYWAHHDHLYMYSVQIEVHCMCFNTQHGTLQY